MKYAFPTSSVVLYNYDQPRVGDVTYANFHDTLFPWVNWQPTSHRSIHALDGVPQVVREGSNGDLDVTILDVTILGLFLIPNNPFATSGYRHNSTEFWQLDPAGANTTIQCIGQEDPTCQLSQHIFAPLLGINADHLTYYGILMSDSAAEC